MVFKFAFLVMIVFLNSPTDGKYLLVKLEAEMANKGFEAEQDNRACQANGCKYIYQARTFVGIKIIVTTNQISSQLCS